ncbi:universal stress protein [soil metagenome]
MTRTVIVPLDGSDGSEQALPVAGLFAERQNGNLKLVSVVEVSTEFDAWIDTAPFSLEDELDSWLTERREYLNQVAARLGDGVDIEVRVGRPADEIRAAAEETGSAMVVMASHGRGGLQQLVLGSVALKVIHDIQCPVVAVHMQAGEASTPTSLDSVLLPTDGSEFSESIIDDVLSILGEPKPLLHLVRVLQTPAWGATSMDAGLVSQYLEASREMSREQLEGLASQLRERGYEVSVELRDGKPGDQILKSAAACNADLIAMATHGRGNIGRLLLGSVAQHVLHRTEVPLLLINPEVD